MQIGSTDGYWDIPNSDGSNYSRFLSVIPSLALVQLTLTTGHSIRSHWERTKTTPKDELDCYELYAYPHEFPVRILHSGFISLADHRIHPLLLTTSFLPLPLIQTTLRKTIRYFRPKIVPHHLLHDLWYWLSAMRAFQDYGRTYYVKSICRYRCWWHGYVSTLF